jgi:hypothetical protein
MGAEGAGLAQHGVDQGGLAVIDVSDDRDVSDGVTPRHEGSTLPGLPENESMMAS